MNPAEVKKKLDKVGCGFCLAKWTQVTMHLGTGMTHSCHHPVQHKIPLSELRHNPSALHNTKFKKKRRREMLEGKRPSECNYCWNVEDSSKAFSDRVFKSSEPWSIDQFDKIKSLKWDEDYNPRYLEVSFSNTCNFKCAYCGPQYSSKWVEEIEEFGAYKDVDNYNDIEYYKQKNEFPYKKSEHNPYLVAFRQWWPTIFPDLYTFRITGGEPLLAKDTFTSLEYIRDNYKQNQQISLAINTNLGVPDKLIDKFIDLAEDLSNNNKVRELIVFSSIEAFGKQAEYTRHGLKTDKFWNNVEKILTKLPKVTVNIMATFNALSVFTYDELIDKVFELKKKYANGQRYWISPIQLDTSYLRWPAHLSVKILEEDHKKLILKSAKKALYYGMKEFTHDNYGFTDVEIQKIKRIYDYAIGKGDFDVETQRTKFVKFVNELDRRRKTNFTETFPELKELYAAY